MNNKIEKLAKIVLDYKNLNEEDKNLLDNKIANDDWKQATDIYQNYCNSDKQLVKAKAEYAKIKKILDAKADDYFYDIVEAEDFDYNNEAKAYTTVKYNSKQFSKEKLNIAEEICNNWNEIQAELKQERKQIKKSKLKLLKEQNLEKLNKKEEYYKQQADIYKQYKNQMDLQKYYKENEATTIRPLEVLIDNKQSAYASKVLEEVINEKPYVICYQSKPKSLNDNYFLENALEDLQIQVNDFIIEQIQNKPKDSEETEVL